MPQFLHSWPVLFVSALVYHIGKLLTFRHDGRSLPRLDGPFLIPLLALSTLAGFARYSVLSPGRPPLTWLLAQILFLAIVYGLVRFFRKPALFSGFLLLTTGIDLLAAGAGVLVPGLGASHLWGLLLEGWGGTSLGVLYLRMDRGAT